MGKLDVQCVLFIGALKKGESEECVLDVLPFSEYGQHYERDDCHNHDYGYR